MNSNKINQVKYFLIWLLCFVSLTFLSNRTYGQDSLRVTGTVKGDSGEPVEGVSVSVEGVLGTPAVTDENGQFQVTTPGGDAWIMINPVDTYKSKRIYLNNRKSLILQLTPIDMESGYDLINDQFGPKLRRDFVGAFSAQDPKGSRHYPNQTVDQFFQNKIPGLWATVQSGMPLSGTTTFLRGIRSMHTTSQPLYIVDGLPLEAPGMFQSNLSGYDYNPLSTLEPNDITNITILKDYLGSSHYGVRGSNGVVLIETLKPTELQTTINFSYRTGFSLQPDRIPQLNSDQYKTFANEVLMSSGLYEENYTREFFQLFATENDPEYFKYNKNTNWQDYIFRDALMNDFFLNVMGGDEIARYGLSFSYLKYEGIIKDTDASRVNARFVGSFNIFDWLRMYISTNLSTNNASLNESVLSEKTSPILTSLFKAPILYPFQFDEDGQELSVVEHVNSLGISNPVSIIDKFEGSNKNYRFTTSFKVEGDLWQDHLKWTSMLGINLNSLTESIFMPNTGMELYYNDEAWNVIKKMNNNFYSIYSDNFITFNHSINEKHLINAAAGVRIHQNSLDIDWGIAKNAHEKDEYRQLQDGTSFLREMGGDDANWNRLGSYANASYSYLNRYIMEAGLVGEFSSRVGKNAQDMFLIGEIPFGIFYSAGVAWRISSEQFMKNIYWLEELKLRFTYGEAGNDDIGNLAGLDYYTADHYRETSAMIPGILIDQSIKFERNKQVNAGIDLSLFSDRISLTADWFNIKTEDMFVYEPQPTFMGFDLIPTNNGELSNRGWELSFYSRIFNLKKLKVDISLQLAGFQNRVESIKNDAVVTPFPGGYFISRIGEPVLSFYGYNYLGIYSTEAEAENEGLVNGKGIAFGSGDARFEDISGPEGIPDGVINELDRINLGSPIPKLYGGATTTFSYGRWSVSANLQIVTGQKVFNYVRYENEKMTDLSNQSTHTLSRWTYEGQKTNVPRALYNDPIGNSEFSSRWIEDGSYMRIKYLTLSYSIPQKLWLLRNLEVFATATNLYTFTKYLGYDPEFSFSYSILEQGIDYGFMPHTQSYILGVRIGL